MAENNPKISDENPDMPENQQTMLEKEAKIRRNIFFMRSRILSMQVKVAVDKIQAQDCLKGIVDSTYDTENSREKAETAFLQHKYDEADRHIVEAEQQFSQMASKFFPSMAKIEEKPKETKYTLIMKRNKASSNHAGITVMGSKEDMMQYADSAKKAFATLEKARKWLVFYAESAQELVAEMEAIIADRYVPDESMNREAGPDAHDYFAIELNQEQKDARTPLELPPKQTVHDLNVEEGRIYLDNVNKSFTGGSIDEAEHFSLKGKTIDTNHLIDEEQDYLNRVGNASAKNTKSTKFKAQEKERCESESPRPEDLNLYIENTYLQIAENAYNDKNYDRALVFLDKLSTFYTSERATNLRKQIQDEINNSKRLFVESGSIYLTGNKPSAPTRKEVLDNLIASIQQDIETGNFDKAEQKLQTPGFVKCIQLKKLRIELKEKRDLKENQDNMTIRERNKSQVTAPVRRPEQPVEPGQSVEFTKIEKLDDVHAKEAGMCINVAEKAYYNGDLEKAERLLKKAQRLYPTERAKKTLAIVYTTMEEFTKFEKLVKFGNEAIQQQNYDSAKTAFEKAKQLVPSDERIEAILAVIQGKITKRSATVSTSEPVEGTSMGAQSKQKPEGKLDRIDIAKNYTDWAQDAYNKGNIELAETQCILAEKYNSTELSRVLLVKTLRAKHLEIYISALRNENISSAEVAFVKGNFKKAMKYLAKPDIHRNSYVKDLNNNVVIASKRNSSWIKMILGWF